MDLAKLATCMKFVPRKRGEKVTSKDLISTYANIAAHNNSKSEETQTGRPNKHHPPTEG